MLCTLPPKGKAAKAAAQYRGVLPVLATERLTLRPPSMEDYPTWAEIFAQETKGHLGGPHTDKETWASFASYSAGWLLYGHGLFTIEHRDTGETLGFVTFGLEWEDEDIELGWMLPARTQGQGYASEAAARVADFAKDLVGPGNFVSYIFPTNAASTKVAARIGAARDASAEAAISDVDIQVWRHGSPT